MIVVHSSESKNAWRLEELRSARANGKLFTEPIKGVSNPARLFEVNAKYNGKVFRTKSGVRNCATFAGFCLDNAFGGKITTMPNTGRYTFPKPMTSGSLASRNPFGGKATLPTEAAVKAANLRVNGYHPIPNPNQVQKSIVDLIRATGAFRPRL